MTRVIVRSNYSCNGMRMAISDAESVVMEILWQRGPSTAEDVVVALSGSQDWAEPTIKTLLNRLLKKRAVRAEKEGRRYRYVPMLEREAWVTGESKGLLDRLFDGRVAPLVAHFSAHRKLSKRDIAELRRLIEELDDGH
jgi:BlaI family transcriptional regulator, penicillinase repressor